jgi:uncharacterized protein YjiS (DUF1127 family)
LNLLCFALNIHAVVIGFQWTTPMKNTQQTDCHYAPAPKVQAECDDKVKVGWLRGLYGRYKHWRSLGRTRRALMSLNDAQLRDIGLSRDDLPYRDERR